MRIINIAFIATLASLLLITSHLYTTMNVIYLDFIKWNHFIIKPEATYNLFKVNQKFDLKNDIKNEVFLENIRNLQLDPLDEGDSVYDQNFMGSWTDSSQQLVFITR